MEAQTFVGACGKKHRGYGEEDSFGENEPLRRRPETMNEQAFDAFGLTMTNPFNFADGSMKTNDCTYKRTPPND